MDSKSVTIRKNKVFIDKLDIVKRYFKIMAIIAGCKLTSKELALLSFICLKGNLASVSSRKEFTSQNKITPGAVNNIISALYKKKFLVKEEGKIRINPKINIDFNTNDEFYFNIGCIYKQNQLKTE